ncbi:phage tail assembly protein [Sphingomonas morindae]|uniref:Phage tail assembly protein n=1 Tax=Sphingomonas morindae TaxID=1541170 RepID=A0ABY4X745_9SPHN|nr:phage tail assembly protein [Sphingomonas morindae]USI72732.1 phage tail assembly protein [Sphingomonas morindae]
MAVRAEPPHAHRPATVSVPLDVPLKRGDTRIETVLLRRPGPGALRGLRLLDLVQADTDAMFALLPRITEPTLHAADLEALDIADFVELSNQVAGFLPQRGANTGSPIA